jgi:hypothetical protein
VSRYPECDLSGIKTYRVARRSSLVRREALYREPENPERFEDLWRSLPDILAARDLRALVERVRLARERGAGILVLSGAHVIKTGLSTGLIRLMREGWITALALNGAGVIHDLELAFFGQTSEDVAAELSRGRFGMARETSLWINQWTVEAARRREGLGEGLGRAMLEKDPSAHERSVLAAAYHLGIPVTVHLAIGADINHQHPSFDGAAAGETSARDFRILCHQVMGLASGAALNLGSAVILPEVFLKSVSVCTNLGLRFRDLTTAVFDFQRQYRPMENVVRRPTLSAGKGYYLVGHHEILLPLFFHALLWAGSGDSVRPSTGKVGKKSASPEKPKGARRPRKGNVSQSRK